MTLANVVLGSKAVGSIVKIKVNGVYRDWIVVHQGKPSSDYDESCNGTWLLMKDIYELSTWGRSYADYEDSGQHSQLNSTFLDLLDADIRDSIKQVKIPYAKRSSGYFAIANGANGLPCRLFLLSFMECGFTSVNYSSNEGAKLDYFTSGHSTAAGTKRIAYYNSGAATWWIRSPRRLNMNQVFVVTDSGSYAYVTCGESRFGVRPAMIMPSSLYVVDDGTVVINTPPTAPTNIVLPDVVRGGTNIKISWDASVDAENNLFGYEIERSCDGGTTWSHVYTTSSTSFTDSIVFGWTSVQYRVKAYDTGKLESDWTVSEARAVINNVSPTAPASITVPGTVLGGKTLAISWGASTDQDDNLAGYKLERKVSTGAWTLIYTGTARTYTDTITKGWIDVTYRVKAYDTDNAESDYVTSPKRDRGQQRSAYNYQPGGGRPGR